MNDITEFLRDYKRNKKLKIRFIDRFENEKTKVYKMGSISKYSDNCLVVSLGDMCEFYINMNTNFFSVRKRIGEVISPISHKVLEFNYNE